MTGVDDGKNAPLTRAAEDEEAPRYRVHHEQIDTLSRNSDSLEETPRCIIEHCDAASRTASNRDKRVPGRLIHGYRDIDRWQ